MVGGMVRPAAHQSCCVIQSKLATVTGAATTNRERSLTRKDIDAWDALAVKRERHREWTSAVGLPVTHWLIDALAVRPGETVLELAAGAGDVGFAILEHLHQRVALISTDVSPAALEVAQRVAAERGLSGIVFDVRDAQELAMPSASVDAVVCRWGFMLMRDPAAALSETARVLRSGGRLACSVWADPERNPWTAITAQVLSQVGYVPIATPTQPGGMFSLADPNRLREMIQASGLVVQRIASVPVEFRYRGVEEYVVQAIDQPGHRGDFFRGLADEQREEAIQLIARLLELYRSDAGYVVPAETLNVLASKPSTG